MFVHYNRLDRAALAARWVKPEPKVVPQEVPVETVEVVAQAPAAVQEFVDNRPFLCKAVILRRVCDYYDVCQDDAIGPRKFDNLAWVRQVACFVMKDMLNTSDPDAARVLKKDRTSMIYAVQKIAGLIDQGDEVVIGDVERIKKGLLRDYRIPPSLRRSWSTKTGWNIATFDYDSMSVRLTPENPIAE